ncbi:MAG: helix-turn-helix domain-containing protein [Bilophila wadsworthia]
MESLQERLKAVRGAMTQSEFATRLRTPLTTLGRYERGANMPDLAFIINVCTIFDVSPEWLLFGRGVAREQSKEYPSGQACQCPLVLKELDEERTECRAFRRKLSTLRRNRAAAGKRAVAEELARLRPFPERVEAALSDGPAARGVFHHTGLCPRSFPIGSRPRPAPSKAGAFPVSEGIWGLRSLERAKPLIAEADHGVRIPFAGACGRRIFSGSCAGCLSGRESGDSG